MTIKINDILFTKDGRKSGNLTCIDFNEHKITFMSDYGNKVVIPVFANYKKQFYTKLGKADVSHKYYNYKDRNPELFI